MKLSLIHLTALASAAVTVCYDNDNDAFIPEMWANESLVILEESMVMCNLVHRDFENQEPIPKPLPLSSRCMHKLNEAWLRSLGLSSPSGSVCA